MNDIINTQGNNLCIPHSGGFEDFDPSDLEVGELSLQQKTSKQVEAEITKPGDIFDTLNGVVIGNETIPCEIIPLHHKKVWLSQYKDGKKEFVGEIPFSPANANWKYDGDMMNNRPVKNNLNYVWKVLVLGADGNVAMPCLIYFGGYSRRAGQKLNTLVVQGQAVGKLPYETTAFLSSIKTSNDQGTFHMFNLTNGKPTPQSVLDTAKNWYGIK